MGLSDITRSLCELDSHWRSSSVGESGSESEIVKQARMTYRGHRVWATFGAGSLLFHTRRWLKAAMCSEFVSRWALS
jgi:hypothetical protein